MATTASQKPPANVPATPTVSHGSRKGKSKKAADPAATEKQIAETIATLERNKAGEKDEALEIEREVKKANREMSNLLSTIEQPMSRLEVVQKRYSELFGEMKRMEREISKSKKRGDQLQKEKDSSRSELSKLNTVKDKLEKLCRELQKENKKLKDDNRRLGETETRMRNELHERLQGMVSDVKDFIDQKDNPEDLPANAESDELFRQKYKSFIDQYELRELQFNSLLRTKEIEVQYQSARFEQQKKAQEHEAGRCRQLTAQVSTFSHTENELRNQLNVYVEKFKQVEDTLNNSNDLFLTFRREMEEMSKKTKRLEKENSTLTRKHELTSSNILQMAEDRTRAQREIDALKKKNENLEKLCRGMQAQGRGGEKGTTVTNGTRERPARSGGATEHGQGLPHIHRHPHHHHHHHHSRSSASNPASNTQSAQQPLPKLEYDEVEGTESDYELDSSANDDDDEEDEERDWGSEDSSGETNNALAVWTEDDLLALPGWVSNTHAGDGDDDTEDDTDALLQQQQLEEQERQQQLLRQRELQMQEKQKQTQATAGAKDSRFSWFGGRKNSGSGSGSSKNPTTGGSADAVTTSMSPPPPKVKPGQFVTKTPGGGFQVHGVRS